MSSDDCSPTVRLGLSPSPLTATNFDFIQHCRPLHNGRKSPPASGRNRSGLGSYGYAITGYHELLVPRKAAALE